MWTPLLAEAARPARIRQWRYAHWLVVGTVCFGAFMGQLDASIVTLTFPSLSTEFGASLAAVQWVSLCYLLTVVALLTPIGRLSDSVGRKRVYIYGFAVFTMASVACGLAASLPMLLIFRVLQAAGAAMLQANSVALVTTSVPHGQCRTAFGVQAAAQALGLAIGPMLGGLLVAGIGWRAVFWVNVPVGMLALAAGYCLLPQTRSRRPVGTFDWAGSLLLAAASGTGLLALSAASGLPLPWWTVGGLLVVAVSAGCGFARRQRCAAGSLIDPALLRNPALPTGLLGALCGYLVLFAPLVLVPQVLPSSADRTSLAGSGLVLSALPAGFAFAATIVSGKLPARLSNRSRCTLGAFGCELALAIGALTGMHGPALPPVLLLLGAALGLFTPANNAVVMSTIPVESAGVGSGLLNMSRAIGTALGVAMVTLGLHIGGTDRGTCLAVCGLMLAAFVMLVIATVEPSRAHRPVS